ncbi:MAG: TlpA family protein disulfide reductase [Candidatus Nitrohelix vancouverensis]|uniref:TlpA family protein disulfide reductase n=1 Tax=Candidatus Nitrohelix vancouverensis TaxID=2705534 RepID=A0A7T0C3J5_9BACT|nr:MAG: TlpA family protein disulfide reductase [Candidatus Nitrohelix vancouverensis]
MVQLNEAAPDLIVGEWAQGAPSNISQEAGNVILIEVFQVNCPGCFIGGLPEAIEVYEAFKNSPLTVWGLATAFEDYDKNSLSNLKLLLESGQVVGETLAELGRRNLLDYDRLGYSLPFPVAMDSVVRESPSLDEASVNEIIYRDIPQFDEMTSALKNNVRQQVKEYLSKKTHSAKTFEMYKLRGTPSSILIDKKGRLRECLFGSSLGLKEMVEALLNE